MTIQRTLLLTTAVLLAACTSDDDGGTTPVVPPDFGATETLVDLDTTTDTEGIITLGAEVDARIRAVFDNYAQLTTPSGRRIHFLSQAGVSDNLLFRVRGILRQHTFDVEGSSLGADKSAVYDEIALSNSVFAVYTNSSTFDPLDADVIALNALFGDTLETLDASTIVQEGSANYTLPSPAIDETIGSTAEFVLRRGLSSTIPAFQTNLDAALANATTMDLFRPDMATPTDRIDDEYLSLALEVYSGLWGHDPNSDGTAGAAGEYDFSNRAAMEAGDPMMVAVIESFFAQSNRYPAFLDEVFTGTFEMTFDPLLPYTERSQYNERCGIRGTSTARINGNELDNLFLGNDEATLFMGMGGNDLIEGGAGNDRAIYQGNQADYTITDLGNGVFRIEDSVANRDGIDDLRGIFDVEFLGDAAVVTL